METVSICIPTFNYGKFLPEAIASVLAQTYGDFELLVVDNCSTDNTQHIAEEFARRDSRIRYIRNSINLGICGNFNRALELAAGTYIKILCADDWLARRSLEKSVAALSLHQDAALVSCGRLLVPESRRPMGYERYCRSASVINGYAAIDRCLFGTNYIGVPSAVMFRRAMAARGFDPLFPHLLDLEMWFHLLEQGSLVCIPEPLAMIRQHAGQITRDNAAAGRIVEDKKRLFSIYAARPYVQKSRLKIMKWRLRIAYNAWSASRSRVSAGSPRPGDFVPPVAFYCLLPAMIAARAVSSAIGRLRAMCVRRAD